MSIPIEFIIGGVFVGSIGLTFFLARRFSNKKSVEVITTEPIVSVPVIEVVTETPSAAVVETVSTPQPSLVCAAPINVWVLEVNGNVKFDIKVEWSNGLTFVYSGTAPQVYRMNRPSGIIPVNTSGIAPEWADDGISYQWSLNDYHWC